MCGIAGIINQNNHVVDESVINSITDTVAHRGPDGRGIYIHNNIALGHRRLSIIDLSAHANQPMFYGDDLVIVFNGEIYNYIELREELKQAGFSFQTQSDTEVILAAYKHWGNSCLNRFNGMWAFAIYDKAKQKIFCARDRFGIKPFYYAVINHQFVFGSEIRQLLELMPQRKANLSVLADYFVTGFEEHKADTFFEGIRKLLPAHYLEYDLNTHRFNISRYYEVNIDPSVASLSLDESTALYESVFADAVKLRLRSDVKVGTCLSGGVDSSAVALFASQEYAKHTTQKFSAVNASSTEKHNDESGYAKTVSDALNLDLHITQPSADNFLSVLDKTIVTQEEPFGSPSIIMQYFVMQKARETGTIVMLDGQGGDETFLGYERYFPALVKSQPFIKRFLSLLEIAQNTKLNFAEVLFYYFYFTRSNIRIRRTKRRASIFKADFVAHTDFSLVKKFSDSYNDIIALQKMEIETTQLAHLLKYEDRNSMAHGIEARLPFLDYRCVETALAINNKFKIKDGWTKYIVRNMMNDNLPASIVWRTNKIGFEAPTSSWLRDSEEIENVIKQSVLLKSILKKISSEQWDNKLKWKLYNVAKWEQLFNVSV
jgi:asparagine synthase (glutamine-hydrolysing)